ncbi:hypothetical protein ACWGQ9_07435 [Streptomyces parvus]
MPGSIEIPQHQGGPAPRDRGEGHLDGTVRLGTAADGPEQTGRPTEVGPTDAAAGPTSPDGTGQSAIGR